MKDYGCKATRTGPGHTCDCDQPATHPLTYPADPEHWCDQCCSWWVPANDDGSQPSLFEEVAQH